VAVPLTAGSSLTVGPPRTLLAGDATPTGFDVVRDHRLLVGRRGDTPGDRPHALLGAEPARAAERRRV